MEDKIFGIFSFSSSHYAIAGEQAVIANIKDARLIPLPPEISAGCGLVLQVNSEDIENVKKNLKSAEVPYSEIFMLKIENKKRIVEKLI